MATISKDNGRVNIDLTPQKPMFENIPNELKVVNQWCNWFSADGQKNPRKIPIHAGNGHPISMTDSKCFVSFEKAYNFCKDKLYGRHTCPELWKGKPTPGFFGGIGFILTSGDNFCGIDLDGCVLPDGTLEPWASDIMTIFNSYKISA